MAAPEYVQKLPLAPPPLEEIAEAVRTGLARCYEEVEVSVAAAPPDLREPPFCLPRPGLGGRPHILDIGGNQNQFPKVDLTKEYCLDEITAGLGLEEFQVVGAGAGAYSVLQQNNELVCKVMSGCSGCESFSKVGMMRGDHAGPQTGTGNACEDYASSRVSTLCNVLASRGEPGPVLKVVVRKRRPEAKGDLLGEINASLAAAFDEPVALGGAFAMLKGSAKMHIMSDFTDGPICSMAFIEEEWLRFFDVPAPMSLVGVCISKDPGMDMRMVHAHGHTLDGAFAGHIHHDTAPESVEYEGYFVPAEMFVRVDQTKNVAFDLTKDWSQMKTTGPASWNTVSDPTDHERRRKLRERPEKAARKD